ARLSQGSESLTGVAMYREIATALKVSEGDVALMDSRLSGPDSSLNAPLMEDESGSADRQDFLVSNDPLPDEMVSDSIDDERRVTWLHSALDVLSDRELKIIRERRLQDDGATLEALGLKLGISKERVRQIETRALEKLRAALLETNADRAAYVS
ncbi:MAG TPA: sigma factor-like helix-turn-helix DNA-binding protein, partial [Aurantimonas sp.]